MSALTPEQKRVLAESVHEAYMEIFPTATIEEKLDCLEPRSYVAVTCSPTKGVGVTLDMCERLANRGFRIVPHVAARMVRDKAHLREIVARLNDLPIISLFVPGGDAEKPAGDYTTAYELLRRPRTNCCAISPTCNTSSPKLASRRTRKGTRSSATRC
jgi:methylenetetrahydrofolate reductase (NADPH)